MLLSNNIISLRAVEPEDLDMLYLWENDTSMWECGNNMAPFSRKLLSDYIESYDGDIFKSQQLRFMIVLNDTDTAIGMIDLYNFDALNRRAAIGIMIDTSCRNEGYAKMALDILVTYCYEHIGMHQLYAIAAIDNVASIALFESSNFKKCGKLRSWLRKGESFTDAYILQRLLTHDSLKI